MNIGIVTTWFERGAAYVSRAYKEVLEEDHQVFIYARAGEKYAIGDPLWDGPNVTWGTRTSGKVDTWIDQEDFWRFLDTHSIDCLIFNEQQSWEVLAALKQRSPTLPLGAYVDYYTRETVPFFAVYDFLLCNTKRHYSVFDWHPGAQLVPWGTDTNLFKPPAVRPARPLTFFHSCGMDPTRKGTGLVARAFSRIEGDSCLFIHSQVELSPEIQELARQNSARVQMHIGEVTAPGLYEKGDVYVYPTCLEGIGLTMAEALACGLPVITTDNGPMNEFVQDGFNGKVVSVARFNQRADGYYWPESFPDESSLQEAMRFYVGRTEELTALRQTAREYAQTHLDWKRNAASLPSTLRELGGKGKRVDAALLSAMIQYDKRRSPNALKDALRRAGAGRVKQAISKVLGRR